MEFSKEIGTCPLLQKNELKSKIVAGRMKPKLAKLLKELKPEDELTPEMVTVIQTKVIQEVNETLNDVEIEPIADPAAELKVYLGPKMKSGGLQSVRRRSFLKHHGSLQTPITDTLEARLKYVMDSTTSELNGLKSVDTESKTETEIAPKSEPDKLLTTETVTEQNAQHNAQTKADTKAETTAELNANTQVEQICVSYKYRKPIDEPETEPEITTEIESITEKENEQKMNPKIESEAELGVDPEAETKTQQEVDPKIKMKTNPKYEPETEPEFEMIDAIEIESETKIEAENMPKYELEFELIEDEFEAEPNFQPSNL